MDIYEKKDWIFSKTSYLRGRQCPKMLYLFQHKRESINNISLNNKAPVDKGFAFEKQVHKNLFPKGIHLEQQLGKDYASYPSLTKKLLDSEKQITLFEAGIISHHVLVLVDVLIKDEEGNIKIYEIKNSKQLKSIALWDTGLQYFVCKSFFGDRLQGFYIILKGSSSPFKVMELTSQLVKRQEKIKSELKELENVIMNPQEPDVEMGKKCYLPNTCVFISYCEKKANSKQF